MAENDKGFLEVAAKISGAGEQALAEAKDLDQVENADIDTEKTFASGRRSSDSAVHRAVFGRKFPLELFDVPQTAPDAELKKAMDKCVAVLKEHKNKGTLFDHEIKVSEAAEQDLAAAGYWGMLIDRKHGGQGANFQDFARFLSEVAEVDPSVAGLGSVHGCIGAVDPLTHFPPEKSEIQDKYLNALATGKRLSAFALTEPGAGSDLTAVKTTAVLDGDHYVVNGRKLFITNAKCGRTVGLVCLIDGKKEVLIVDLPDKEDETFKIHRYGIYALIRAHNIGMEFTNFRVPKENLLVVRDGEGKPDKGKGLVIAYHGLNRGRVALCANAAGTMRGLLASMIPWADFRITYKRPISGRQLVRKRMGEMASLIVACDALTDWCAAQLDMGFRGEMECIIAKRFGSEALKHSVIEYVMKTHGGRSFLKGHQFGDYIGDYLAPCIYEGEGEMLSQKFYGTLLKEQQRDYFGPIAKKVTELQGSGQMKGVFNPINPVHLWMMREPLMKYSAWVASRLVYLAGQSFKDLTGSAHGELSWMPKKLRKHAEWAALRLERSSIPVSVVAAALQGRLLEEQCYLARLSLEVQDLLTILATSIWAARRNDEAIQLAAEIACEDLKLKITGHMPGVLNVPWNLKHYGKKARLGKMIVEGKFPGLDRIETADIMQKY
ncbi:MAG: acyl-CoA/acyl-ACP dehydrogenase [bacterium]|nr:acyl-CoA/acyl-ACP dehydrogenase [bacterium]